MRRAKWRSGPESKSAPWPCVMPVPTPDAAAALRRDELAGSLRDLSRMALAAAP